MNFHRWKWLKNISGFFWTKHFLRKLDRLQQLQRLQRFEQIYVLNTEMLGIFSYIKWQPNKSFEMIIFVHWNSIEVHIEILPWTHSFWLRSSTGRCLQNLWLVFFHAWKWARHEICNFSHWHFYTVFTM